MENPKSIDHTEECPKEYNHLEIEARWRKIWQEIGIDKTPLPSNNQEKFYALSMFPYPSGSLHMGHVRNYVITDVIARSQRMKGKAVLHPMGWDAFGLPAENAAIERNIEPKDWTLNNISQMRNDLKTLGLSIDWDREQTTCLKDYYKWTQYIFLKLYEAGLAYQKKATVNWDPIDKTVLANEQVDTEGKSWRSGAVVEKKELNQWFLKITDYADVLLKDLNSLDNWPQRVKTMQYNWIGKSKGLQIEFKCHKNNKTISVYTTRPDTIYGVSYVALSHDNKIVDEIMSPEKKASIEEFRLKCSLNPEKSRNDLSANKNGLHIGSYVINPINGELVPVWIADYVLSDYGSGAVMGVPGHDERDYEFALKYDLPIKTVISPKDDKMLLEQNKAFTQKGILTNSSDLSGLDSIKATEKITEMAVEGDWGKPKTQYKLRDWLISRQRFWGCPIPIVHCPHCGIVPIKYDNLPVELPKDYYVSKSRIPSLTEHKVWKEISCPKCNKTAQRETDTMDTFMCSSWYYLRFADPNNKEEPFNKDNINHWLPVDQYVGGIEHAILHLLYSRFLTKALNKLNMFNISEPFNKLLTQGMVQSITYKNSKSGKYIKEDDIQDKADPRDPITNEQLTVFYEKMSKSKYNGVEPSLVINRYGADTARMFILFKAPPEKDLEWNESDVEGQYRFINRIWKLTNSLNIKDYSVIDIKILERIDFNSFQSVTDKLLRRCSHQAINNIDKCLQGQLHLNTAISEMMKLTNSINENIQQADKIIIYESLSILIRLLSPFAPHVSEELWHIIGNNTSVHLAKWPICDESALIQDTVKLVIQICGKTRGTVEIPRNLEKNTVESFALGTDIAKKWLKKSDIKRVIVVPNKLINFVL